VCLALSVAAFIACGTWPAAERQEAESGAAVVGETPARESTSASQPGSEPSPELVVGDVSEAEATCLRIDRIEVWKQKRMLRAYCKNGAVVAMDIAIGRQELGRKTSAGDNRTPEGRYRIVAPASEGRFHLFIPIDYPARADADIAWLEDRISGADYWRIVSALKEGLLPPQDTPLGGDIGFHGEGERWQGDSQNHDWTYGCIAVTDREIEFLAERIEIGVPVWIHP
jgi:murein L,D-transpeptidase YafK